MPFDDISRDRVKMLKEKRKGITAPVDTLNLKVQRLGEDLAKLAYGAPKFQVEQELESAKKERDEAIRAAEQELKSIDQQLRDIDDDRMYRLLMEMNYFDQSKAFNKYLAAQRISAFLIHGPTSYGQDWLLRQLLERLLTKGELERIEIDLGSRYSPKEVSGVWDELAGHLKLEPFPPPSPDVIAKSAASWLETKTVVLILFQIDAWTPQQAHALIDEFWKNLVTAAQDTLKGNTETRLIMFLVDYSDSAQTWNLPLIDAPSDHVLESIPIRLQAITPFTYDIVKPWVQYHSNVFADLLEPLALDMETTVKTIIQSSQGAPDEVAKYIYYQCKRSYHPDRWLKL